LYKVLSWFQIQTIGEAKQPNLLEMSQSQSPVSHDHDSSPAAYGSCYETDEKFIFLHIYNSNYHSQNQEVD